MTKSNEQSRIRQQRYRDNKKAKRDGVTHNVTRNDDGVTQDDSLSRFDEIVAFNLPNGETYSVLRGFFNDLCNMCPALDVMAELYAMKIHLRQKALKKGTSDAAIEAFIGSWLNHAKNDQEGRAAKIKAEIAAMPQAAKLESGRLPRYRDPLAQWQKKWFEDVDEEQIIACMAQITPINSPAIRADEETAMTIELHRGGSVADH